MQRESVQMTVSLSPKLYKMAMEVAQREVRSKSELVREALREYLERRNAFRRARENLGRQLAKKGIRNLEDIERLVDAIRS